MYLHIGLIQKSHVFSEDAILVLKDSELIFHLVTAYQPGIDVLIAFRKDGLPRA